MSVIERTDAVDLLAALSEGTRRAGPGEVVQPGPASTRGTSQGRDTSGARQKSNRLVVERVESAPWPSEITLESCAAWRAQVARRSLKLDQACGAAPVLPTVDTDEAEDHQRTEKRRTFTWLRVRDGDGVVWKNVPPWEVDDLSQPVQILKSEERPAYPVRRKRSPIEQLTLVEAPRDPEPIKQTVPAKDHPWRKWKGSQPAPRPSKQGQKSILTAAQIEGALGEVAESNAFAVAKEHWQEWGFKSHGAAYQSLRRWASRQTRVAA